MKIKKVFILFLIYTFSICAYGQNVWMRNVNIEGVQVGHDGKLIIFLPSGTDIYCTQKGSAFYVKSNGDGGTDSGRENMLNLALFSISHSSKVDILYFHNSDECYIHSIRLSSHR